MQELISPNIILNEEDHRYILKDDPSFTFTSVTTFISCFFLPFDSIGIANNLTQNHSSYSHMTPQELVKSWDQTALYGTLIHKEIEDFIKSGVEPKDRKSKAAVNWLRKIDLSRFEIFPEAIVYSKSLKIAGTVDLLIRDKSNNSFSIYDWKTGKPISKNSFGNKIGITPATSDIMDCNFYQYSLQLSLYTYLLEKFYGISIKKLTILHVNESTVTPFESPYLKKTIEEMFTYDIDKLTKENESRLTKKYINSF